MCNPCSLPRKGVRMLSTSSCIMRVCLVVRLCVEHATANMEKLSLDFGVSMSWRRHRACVASMQVFVPGAARVIVRHIDPPAWSQSGGEGKRRRRRRHAKARLSSFPVTTYRRNDPRHGTLIASRNPRWEQDGQHALHRDIGLNHLGSCIHTYMHTSPSHLARSSSDMRARHRTPMRHPRAGNRGLRRRGRQRLLA